MIREVLEGYKELMDIDKVVLIVLTPLVFIVSIGIRAKMILVIDESGILTITIIFIFFMYLFIMSALAMPFISGIAKHVKS